MRSVYQAGTALALAASLWCCAGVKPYEKEYLLHPLMDATALQSLESDFQASCASSYERLSMTGTGGAAATSCPTCGG